MINDPVSSKLTFLREERGAVGKLAEVDAELALAA